MNLDLSFFCISPAKLVETVKQRFISLGGVILEDCSLSSITIYDDLAVSYVLLLSKKGNGRRMDLNFLNIFD